MPVLTLLARGCRRAAGLAALCGALLPAAPAHAGSCGALRSFTGTVVEAGRDGLAVERGGSTTRFARAAGATVVDESGGGVAGWGDLRAGLRVVVCWAFEDVPRAARRVFVTGAPSSGALRPGTQGPIGTADLIPRAVGPSVSSWAAHRSPRHSTIATDDT